MEDSKYYEGYRLIPPFISSRNPDMVTWTYYDGTQITFIPLLMWETMTCLIIKAHDLQPGEPLAHRKFLTSHEDYLDGLRPGVGKNTFRLKLSKDMFNNFKSVLE